VLTSEMTPAERATQLQSYLHEIETLALQVGVWSDVPGVEPSASVRQRVTLAFRRLAAKHPGQCIVLVSHNGAINAGIAALLGLQRDFFCPIDNTAISTIRIQGEQHLILSLNDIAHLATWTTDQTPTKGRGRQRAFGMWRAKRHI